MDAQLSFIDGADFLAAQARARATDKPTSHAAAASVHVARIRQLVLESLAALKQATSEEIVSYIGPAATPSGIRGRIAELEDAGLIRAAGTKPNQRRRECTIYEAAK